MSKKDEVRKAMANVALKKSIEALQSTRAKDMSPKDVKEFMRLAADLQAEQDEVHNGLFVNELFEGGGDEDE